MEVIIMDGKKLSSDILERESKNLKSINEQLNITPTMVVITIGDDNASKVYVRNKEKAFTECGVNFVHTTFDEDISREELIKYIEQLNISKGINGVLIQQPVPDHLIGVEQYITPTKDVDGFTVQNLGKTLHSTPDQLIACTPKGIINILKTYNVPLKGKHVVIIGRSEIVGKPLIGLLLNENCTVTSCNSYTENLKQIVKSGDIVISAIGKPKYIDSSYIGPKCYCVIDVGINRDINNKLCGDCDTSGIIDFWHSLNDDMTRFITPVPGGIGPMTVASLVENTTKAFKLSLNNELLDLIGGK